MNEPGFSRIVSTLLDILGDLDEWGRPKRKLPNCPKCDEDELGVIHSDLMKCYRCGWKIEATGKLKPHRLEVIRHAIMDVLNQGDELSIAALENQLRINGVPFWPGEIQEVVWRLTAAKVIQVSASGLIDAIALTRC